MEVERARKEGKETSELTLGYEGMRGSLLRLDAMVSVRSVLLRERTSKRPTERRFEAFNERSTDEEKERGDPDSQKDGGRGVILLTQIT